MNGLQWIYHPLLNILSLNLTLCITQPSINTCNKWRFRICRYILTFRLSSPPPTLRLFFFGVNTHASSGSWTHYLILHPTFTRGKRWYLTLEVGWASNFAKNCVWEHGRLCMKPRGFKWTLELAHKKKKFCFVLTPKIKFWTP